MACSVPMDRAQGPTVDLLTTTLVAVKSFLRPYPEANVPVMSGGHLGLGRGTPVARAGAAVHHHHAPGRRGAVDGRVALALAWGAKRKEGVTQKLNSRISQIHPHP